MSRFYSLTLSEIKEDNNALIWKIEVPAELKETFRFQPGQHLTFKCQYDGEELRRSYSICSSMDSPFIQVLIKSVNEGRFSSHLAKTYAVGDKLEVMPPSGHFTINLAENKTYVAFAAGSGITPIMGMVYALMERTTNSQFILFYGNSSSQDILLHEAIAHLKDKYKNRFSVHYLMSRQKTNLEVYQGRLDADKIKMLLATLLKNVDVADFFVCGPGQMIDTVCQALSDQGIEQERIHNERFLGDGQEIKAAEKTVKEDAGVTITIDGANLSCDIKAGEAVTLLESAEQAGFDLPYSCKAGVCATCRCRLLEGEVEMINNYSLEQWELDAGYVLSCQSVAKSSKIHISFDE